MVIFFWIMGFFLPTLPAHAAANVLSALTFQPGGVVFELNATPHYRYFTLNNPSRVVVDFENTAASAAMPQPPADHPLVVGVRSAIRNKSDLRVVMELNADAKAVAVSNGSSVQLQFSASANPAPASVAAARPAKKIPENKVARDKTLSTVNAKPVRAKGRDIVIAIDAGHGGKDVGAQGGHGTQEKDVVLAIAKRLESSVNRQPGMKAVMIRNGDYFVKLHDRVKIARDAKADLFVSIHADAFDDPSAHGASVYTLANKGASSQMAQTLADSENAADRAGGATVDAHDDVLASVLMDLSNKAAKEASQHVGSKVLKSVNSAGHLHRKNVQKAGFVVLRSPIPSILVETAFISNPEEEQRLNSRAYQDKMASAVFNGIVAHFKQYAPANTLFAQLQKSGKTATRVAARETVSEPVVVKANTVEADSAITVSAANTRHVISTGETLSGIAQRYGVSMRELRHANGMEDGNLKAGQVLQIPRSS
ncbi:N-acetylmuramoyl-L-alanine amidase [Methylomonas sp. SURF-2]|uniref:N-acetylmuramoyl-L-alanine amidase n=1 Tax=Methylomonas subterranea TaxID=2952225 RepID=A0ABT1THH1_9GAMM|nr:N-acetylmuramoyl-L-alanine amidase [Methylomonas sp. SURF-2]MCQ8104552.1 N-acetylmuramoyl-L-alanine amidase [Methylomonas sp. SURF-2]